MLTLMCPNCRHRFSVQGCCEQSCREEISKRKRENESGIAAPCQRYVANIFVSDYSGGSCVINTSTVVHSPAVSQSNAVHYNSTVTIDGCSTVDRGLECSDDVLLPERQYPPPFGPRIDAAPAVMARTANNYETTSLERPVATTCCDLTSGSVIAATPGIQSGGCLIQCTETDILVQAPHIQIRPKFSGSGGYLMQKRLSAEDAASEYSDNVVGSQLLNGCLELPGGKGTTDTSSRQREVPTSAIKTNECCGCAIRNLCQCHGKSLDASSADDCDSSQESIGSGVQIQVNATVQLPANMGQCRVNITATTATPPSNQVATTKMYADNFGGGGIVQTNKPFCPMENRLSTGNNNGWNDYEQTDDKMSALTWLMPYPIHVFDTFALQDEICKVKRMLQISGWYHEGISWQQSESLLRNASVGKWLMRDSSDSRYIFAVSVQTIKGPTSVRVIYFVGQFRLDATPKFVTAMPHFSCPIKMLEHYVEYSKKMDRTEVWVDNTGEMYSPIYLTKPLVKEVRSLSHLARLVVNRNKLPTDHLPRVIREYLDEYPYTI